jgi:hypothetical protein
MIPLAQKFLPKNRIAPAIKKSYIKTPTPIRQIASKETMYPRMGYKIPYLLGCFRTGPQLKSITSCL